jgi:hypothetical protein
MALAGGTTAPSRSSQSTARVLRPVSHAKNAKKPACSERVCSSSTSSRGQQRLQSLSTSRKAPATQRERQARVPAAAPSAASCRRSAAELGSLLCAQRGADVRAERGERGERSLRLREDLGLEGP